METNKTRQAAWGVLRWPARQLRELTYRESFLVLARRLPFSRFLRKGYQWLAGGGDNILRVSLGESEVLFYVHSPREYRAIESDILKLERFFLGALVVELREGDVS